MPNHSRKQTMQAEDDFMILHGGRGSCAIYQSVLAIETLCKTPQKLLYLLNKKWRATAAARHSNSLKL